MATIQQRKDSSGKKVFDVIFSIRADQWRRSCPDKMTADVKAKEVEAKLAKIKNNVLAIPIGLDKKQLGAWLWDGTIKETVSGSTLPTLDGLITGYLASSFFNEKALVTQRIERTKTKQLLRLIGGKTLLLAITEATLQKYVDARKLEKVVGRTIKKELDILRAIWNGYGLQQRIVEKNWASRFPLKVRLPKFSNKAEPKTLDECTDDFESVYLLADEVHELLAHCRQRQKEVKPMYRWGYAAIAYAAFTSFRRSTMITQEVSMVNFARNELTGWVGKEDSDMERTPRKVPMLPNLPEILQEWLDDGHVGGRYLFGCEPDKMITDIQAWRCWQRYVKGTKFEAMQGQWHILRHSFVSIAFEHNLQEEVVKRFTGHHSEAVARIYRHGSTALIGEKMAGMFEVKQNDKQE